MVQDEKSRKERGERLKALRKKAGLTQLSIAQAAGASHPTYSELERGVLREFNTQLFINLAEVLHTTPEFIMYGTGSEKMSHLQPIGNPEQKKESEKLNESRMKSIDSILKLDDLSSLEILNVILKTFVAKSHEIAKLKEQIFLLSAKEDTVDMDTGSDTVTQVNQVLESTTEPKRRGRPPKKKTEDSSASASVEKEVSLTIPIESFEKGSDTERRTGETTESATEPKRRGRPPIKKTEDSSAAISAADSPIVSAQEAEQPKKRGERKSTGETPSNADTADTGNPKPRRKGGSPPKIVSTPNDSEVIATEPETNQGTDNPDE
jgi:transcriptional regulator with XRE-family HTH domain